MIRLRQTKWKKILLYHAAMIAALLFVIFVYRCPTYYFFHVPCPGCGITRAHLAALSGDWKKAFDYHPLFFTVAPTVLYIVYRNRLKKRLSGRVETICLAILFGLFLIVYIVRVV